MDKETFEKLKPEEQEEVFHHAPFRERGELILASHDPARLTQSLTQEELYLVTRELDLEERVEIVRYASLPQLFFVSDIDCWEKDRVNPKGFVEWLETLQKADEMRLLAWLVEMDYETVVAGFKQVIEVLKPEWEFPSDELLGDRPYFTLDERYFILVNEENIETVRRAIEVLFENHRGRYAAILEGVLGELEYETEEDAYQNRARRLAERGFPEPEVAREIYRPLTGEEFERFPRKNGTDVGATRRVAPTFPNENAPNYLLLRSEDRLFLDDALLLFRTEPDAVREGLEEELAWLSNKVIASDGIGFASEDRVRWGVERARRFVNLGLESLSGRDLGQARQILSERWLELIFRRGLTPLLELRERARGIVQAYWAGSRETFLEFLARPHDAIFLGLFQTVPQCFDPAFQDRYNPEMRGRPEPLRDFRDGEDVERSRRALQQVEGIHAWLKRQFPNVFHQWNLLAKRGSFDIALFPLLATIFVNHRLRKGLSTHSLSEKEVRPFLEQAFERRNERRILKTEAKEKFLEEILTAEETFLRPVWALAFQRLEEELERLDPRRPIDRRYVTSFYFNT